MHADLDTVDDDERHQPRVDFDHHSRDYCDPRMVDRQVNAEDERRLRAVIADRLPALNGPVFSSMICLYENSLDEHFLIDSVA